MILQIKAIDLYFPVVMSITTPRGQIQTFKSADAVYNVMIHMNDIHMKPFFLCCAIRNRNFRKFVLCFSARQEYVNEWRQDRILSFVTLKMNHCFIKSLTRWCFLQMFAILFDPFAPRLLKTLQEMKWWLNI